MKGVILAAGKGSRLYPVTHVVPKPILPIANRMTLEYAFDQLKACGIHEICIVVGETESAIRDALGDGSAFDVSLSYVRQTDPRGLAHAVGFAQEFVGKDDFLLYLGDAIYDQSLEPMVKAFRASKADNVSLVKEVEDPRRFGVANVVDGRIVQLVEKPQDPQSNLAMAGAYVFGPAIWEVLPDLKPSWRNEYEITDAIQMLVDRGKLVMPHVYHGVWFDTGTLDSFLATSHYLCGGDSLLAADAKLDGELGEHVVVGAGARVSCRRADNSVFLPGAQVRVNGEVRDSILGGQIALEGDVIGAVLHGDAT